MRKPPTPDHWTSVAGHFRPVIIDPTRLDRHSACPKTAKMVCDPYVSYIRNRFPGVGGREGPGGVWRAGARVALVIFSHLFAALFSHEFNHLAHLFDLRAFDPRPRRPRNPLNLLHLAGYSRAIRSTACRR